MKNRKFILDKDLSDPSVSAFENALHRFFRIPTPENILDRQRLFIFLVFVSFAILNIARFSIETLLTGATPFVLAINITHSALILLLLLLYSFRVLSLYVSIFTLILFVQIEISVSILGLIGKPDAHIGILTSLTMEGVLILLAIASYIRYLPYFLTLIIVSTLCACTYYIGDDTLWRVTPLLSGVFLILAVMGDYLVKSVMSLQRSKDNLHREQDKIFEFLNMNKEEMLKLIKYSGYKKLSDKQKGRLIGLLDEQTKQLVLDTATDIMQKQRRNLSALDNVSPRLSTYEKEICLEIINGQSINKIALKFNRTAAAIANARTKIRTKLNLSKEENLHEALLKLVGGGISEPQSEQDNIVD